jgi:hypothetical protein
MRALLFVLILLVASGQTPLAQEKEQSDVVNVSFSELVDEIAAISDVYITAIQNRQRTGILTLTNGEVAELKIRILTLTKVLERASANSPLNQPDFSNENKSALTNALLCSNCSGKLPEGGQAKSIENQQQLRRLILARCETILQLVPQDAKAEISQQALFSLEVHFSYLRQISIAYNTTQNSTPH